MGDPELDEYARRNREVFDRALAPYVAAKLEQTTRRLSLRTHSAFFDASGCVPCLFDDERFLRSGNMATDAQARGECEEYCVFWSFADIIMPPGCDEDWVAEQIADEAIRQAKQAGLRARRQTRVVEGTEHIGVLVSRRLLAPRLT